MRSSLERDAFRQRAGNADISIPAAARRRVRESVRQCRHAHLAHAWPPTKEGRGSILCLSFLPALFCASLTSVSRQQTNIDLYVASPPYFFIFVLVSSLACAVCFGWQLPEHFSRILSPRRLTGAAHVKRLTASAALSLLRLFSPLSAVAAAAVDSFASHRRYAGGDLKNILSSLRRTSSSNRCQCDFESTTSLCVSTELNRSDQAWWCLR